jgi:hypothetical protein
MSNSNSVPLEYTNSGVVIELSVAWLMTRIFEDRAESAPVSEEAGDGK